MLNRADSLLNSNDLHKERIDQIKRFKKMATQDIRTLTTSSLSMSGLNVLKQILLSHGRENVAHLPGDWYKLYKNLSSLKDEKCAEGFYRVVQLPRLCSPSMTNGSIQSCLTYMHQRGIVFWYGNDKALKDYVFYDVKFIITILKHILTHEIGANSKTELRKPFFKTISEQEFAVTTFRETGMASKNLLKCLWQNVADTEEIYEVATCILKLFNLCYEADSNLLGKMTTTNEILSQNKQRIFFFPWFVRDVVDTDQLQKLWTQQVPPMNIPLKCKFTFEYSIPTSLYEQFSVQLQSLLAKGHRRKDWKNTIYVKQDAVQLLVRRVDDKANNMASIVIQIRSKSEKLDQMYKLCVSVIKSIQNLREVFPGILYNKEYICPHCILTDAEAPHSIPLDEALLEHPGNTRQLDCKQDEIPAALHYPKLPGKSGIFNTTLWH